MENIKTEVVKSKKKKSNRCFNCNIKIGLLKFNCKCSDVNNFCSSCVLPEVHGCLYNFKEEQRNNLKDRLVKVVNNKVIKI